MPADCPGAPEADIDPWASSALERVLHGMYLSKSLFRHRKGKFLFFSNKLSDFLFYLFAFTGDIQDFQMEEAEVLRRYSKAQDDFATDFRSKSNSSTQGMDSVFSRSFHKIIDDSSSLYN